MFGRDLGRLLGYTITRGTINAVQTGVQSVVRGVSRNPRRVGKSGEKQVRTVLRALPSSYYVLSDLLIRNGNETAQIDFAVVGPTGLYVIEVKNYHGRVEGNPQDRTWILRHGSQRHEFYNPMRQNQVHIGAVLGHFPALKSWEVHSIIAFGEGTELSDFLLEQVSDAMLNALIYKQTEHANMILRNPLDGHRVQELMKIGKIHSQLGVEPGWVAGAYHLYWDHWDRQIRKHVSNFHERDQLRAAMLKAHRHLA